MTAPGDLHHRRGGVCHQALLVDAGDEDEDGVTRVKFTLPHTAPRVLTRQLDFSKPPVAEDTCHFAHQCGLTAT